MSVLSDIVVTGVGAVTPLGVGADVTWDALVEGRCGIAPITSIDVSSLPVRRAGEIRDFHPKDYMSTKLSLDLEPYMQYAWVAAQEAIRQSGLTTFGDRVGIVMASALSGINVIGSTATSLVSDGKSAGPKFLTKAMANITAAQLGIQYGITGPSMTVSTACSSGGDAATLAALFLRSGMADAMIVMAGEEAVCPTLIQSLVRAGALSKAGESLPFDASRSGFVLGSGGGSVVLETAEHARNRGATILADLAGCANNTDAYNPVSPDPEGRGIAACMRLALQDAGLVPSQIGYLNAHGTATVQGDVAECRAIADVFGDSSLYVSSTKGATGHMMGAGGLVELIFCVLAVSRGILPPNTGCSRQDTACPVTLVPDVCFSHAIDYAMSDSMGFGGQNSCVIIGKHKE
ncbi:MAG: beta-ketoacyl-[Oscillospiraceae bacterium]|nr:beta-ketoacyl-[acyl-carrier-protein] synthase family protein [Oscillospiraceae bacterium]